MNYRQAVRSVVTLANRRGISWTSRFDDSVEAKYQSELIGKTLDYWRFTLVFGSGLLLLFAIWHDAIQNIHHFGVDFKRIYRGCGGFVT